MTRLLHLIQRVSGDRRSNVGTSSARASRPSTRIQRLSVALMGGLLACMVVGVAVALSWHADGLSIEAVCEEEAETYTISATIQQSAQWPGAFVKSITPSSFPGDTSGAQTVVVKIGWPNSNDTQTFTRSVTLAGDCADEESGALTVVKTVVNDNGGTAVSEDFTMNVSGPTQLSFSGSASGTSNEVLAGTYTVTESGPSGYALSYGGDCNGSGTVTVPDDGAATCVLTNDDEAPAASTMIVRKVVVNHGGNATASDFSFSVNGAATQGFDGDGQNELTVPSGTYAVTEPAVAGYTTTYANCSGIELAAGASATCTITNEEEEHEEPTRLVVVKRVISNDGGDAVPSDWTMNVSGPTQLSFPGDSQGTSNEVEPGAYVVTESGGPSGYSLTYSGDCDASGNVTVAKSHQATCVLTNDDLATTATLIVRKVVVNDDGGTARASNFSFSVNGGPAQGFEADGQNELTVQAGNYTITEPAVAGYTTTYSGCGDITLAPNESRTCTIVNNDVSRGRGSIVVSKSANPTSVKEPGGQVQYSVRITNTSASLDVTITQVVDDKFGDLDDEGGKGYIDVPFTLAPGAFRSFQFNAQVIGVGGTAHVNTVTASGTDEVGNGVSDSDDARVDITERLIDLVIVKEATSPTPLNGIVTYSLTVTNKGADTATNVQLADPAPAGITYLTAVAAQGTCNVSASLVTCGLGAIGPGQIVTVTVTARATQVGQHTNTATVTGGGGRESNPADNADSAVTVVPAPVTPPTPKPEPKPTPKPNVCLTLTVKTKMITADGKRDRVVVKVTAGGKAMKGVRVDISGMGVRDSGVSNRKGIAVLSINPKKAGLLTITVRERNQRVCGPTRIGVVGVFIPPVTG